MELNAAKNSIASKIECPEGTNQIMMNGKRGGVEYVNAFFNCALSIGCTCKRDSDSDSSISISHPQIMAAPVQQNPQPRHASVPPRDSSGHPQQTSTETEGQSRKRSYSDPKKSPTLKKEQPAAPRRRSTSVPSSHARQKVVESVPARDPELEELKRKVEENSSGFRGLDVYSQEGREYLVLTFSTAEAAVDFACKFAEQGHYVAFDPSDRSPCSFSVYKSDLSSWQPAPKTHSQKGQSHQARDTAAAKPADQPQPQHRQPAQQVPQTSTFTVVQQQLVSAPSKDSSGHPQPASKREVQQRERSHFAPTGRKRFNSAPPRLENKTPELPKEKTDEEKKLDFLRGIGRNIATGCDCGGTRVPWSEMGAMFMIFGIKVGSKTPRTVAKLQGLIGQLYDDNIGVDFLKQARKDRPDIVDETFKEVVEILGGTAEADNPYSSRFFAPTRRDPYTQAAYDDWRQRLNDFRATLGETSEATATSAVSATR